MKTALITGLFAALALVASCGPLQEGNRAGVILSGLTGGLSPESDSAPQAGTSGLTREVIESQSQDLMRVSIISREAAALVAKAATNGTRVTWLSAEGISLTFDGGLLSGTRGLGGDLMGADLASAKMSLNGGGNHLRILDFLNGLDQIERPVFECVTAVTGTENLEIFERTYATTILEETCTGDSGSFKNTYWRDAGGVIWQSRQWVSDEVGYMGYQRL